MSGATAIRAVRAPKEAHGSGRVVEEYSQRPLRTHAGYYVEGGLSPFEIEAQRPIREYLSELEPGESIDDYLLRRSEDRAAVSKLFSDGLARPSDAPAEIRPKRADRRRWWTMLFGDRSLDKDREEETSEAAK